MQKELAIVIPCFNESERLNLKEYEDFLTKYQAIDIIFANDGSGDTTGEILGDFIKEFNDHAFLLDYKINEGKARTVQKAFLEVNGWGKYTYISFLDADLAVSLDECKSMYSWHKNSGKDIVMGSRIKRMGSEISRNTARHYFSRVLATFIGNITKLPVYDSQCGAKIFHQNSIIPLFSEAFTSKWLFDIELLIRYRKHFGVGQALQNIEEYPLKKWIEVGGSKIKFSDIIKVPLELLRIHRKYKRA